MAMNKHFGKRESKKPKASNSSTMEMLPGRETVRVLWSLCGLTAMK